MGTNYTAAFDTLTFEVDRATGLTATSQTFPVAIRDSGVPEPNRTVSLQLSVPSGATLGDQNSAVLTIIDDDLPPVGKPLPVVFLGKAPVVKRIAGVAKQDIKMDRVSNLPVTVHYETMDDDKKLTTLTPYVDYLPTKGIATFYPGEQKKTVVVRIFYDAANKGGDVGTDFGTIGFRLYDQSANATLDPNKKQDQIIVKNSSPPVKPTKVQIDPVYFVDAVDPSGPINQLHNPAVITIENNPDISNAAFIRAITTPADADPSYLEWTIKNAKEESGKIDPVDEVRADFYSPQGWTRPANKGNYFVWLKGVNPGRVHIEVHIKDDNSPNGKDYLEAFVKKQQILPVRINLLKGTSFGTKVTPDQATLHLQAVNVYLRQVGVIAVQDATQP